MPLIVIGLLTACGNDPGPPANITNTATPELAAPVANEANSTDAANIAEPAPLPPAPAPAPKPLPPKPAGPSPDYRAIGTEPFWAVTITGQTATLERPDHPPATYQVVRLDNGGAISWTGDGFSLRITPGPCSDGMSDAIWSDRAQVALGSGLLKGCGGLRDDGEAPR